MVTKKKKKNKNGFCYILCTKEIKDLTKILSGYTILYKKLYDKLNETNKY